MGHGLPRQLWPEIATHIDDLVHRTETIGRHLSVWGLDGARRSDGAKRPRHQAPSSPNRSRLRPPSGVAAERGWCACGFGDEPPDRDPDRHTASGPEDDFDAASASEMARP